MAHSALAELIETEESIPIVDAKIGTFLKTNSDDIYIKQSTGNKACCIMSISSGRIELVKHSERIKVIQLQLKEQEELLPFVLENMVPIVVS